MKSRMQALPPERGFSSQEFEQRMSRVQMDMAELNFDFVLLTTESDIRYFTGFSSQFWHSPTRPWFVVLPTVGKPIAVIPEIGYAGMKRTWLDDIRIWPSPRPEDEGISLLVDIFRNSTKGHHRIALPMGPETHLRMPLKDYMSLKALLPGFDFVDATTMLKKQFAVKSKFEIAKIRYICNIASGLFEELPGLLEFGQSEFEIHQRFKIELLQRGADSAPYVMVASGSGSYDNIIMGPTARRLAAGDMLIIDTGAKHDGYFCDFDRNYAFGEPSDQAKRAYDTVYRASEAGLQAARPGVRTSHLWQAMWRVLEAGGARGNDVGRMGHGLGTQLTEWPSIKADEEVPLEPGMVITLEPGMTFAPSQLMVHEENIVITEDGAELLSVRAPNAVPVIRN